MISPAGGSPQQVQQQSQPQIVRVERIDFQDDAGNNYQTFSDVSATRTADTNNTRRGFGIDLNGDGEYNRGTDGLLAFDFDGDGQYTSTDVAETNRYLKVLGGETDLDGDGRVSFQERSDARRMKQQFGSADLDQDGVISGWELSELGAMVVTLGRDGEGNPTSTIQELPGFEADRMPPPPNIFDPQPPQPNPEFDNWRSNMLGQWSSVLGIDLFGALNPSGGQQPGQPFQFPSITAGMFGGGGGMFGGGMFGGGQQSFFPQFNFGFDPMAGQSFDSNGFPSFFTQGVGFL